MVHKHYSSLLPTYYFLQLLRSEVGHEPFTLLLNHR